jgi:hypothetical protein
MVFLLVRVAVVEPPASLSLLRLPQGVSRATRRSNKYRFAHEVYLILE